MKPNYPHRLAEVSLELFGHEHVFDIEVPGHEIEPVALAFEAKGCSVDRNSHPDRLTVHCPENPSQRAAQAA